MTWVFVFIYVSFIFYLVLNVSSWKYLLNSITPIKTKGHVDFYILNGTQNTREYPKVTNPIKTDISMTKNSRWPGRKINAISGSFQVLSRSRVSVTIFMPHLWALWFLVCTSVRSSVRLFRCRLKILVKYFDQGSFWWSWSSINLNLSTHVPCGMTFLILLPNQNFHGPLIPENDSASWACVYYGHMLVGNYPHPILT